MAENSPEVARAVVTIIPSMEGSQRIISDELGAAADSAGKSAGAKGGAPIGDHHYQRRKQLGLIIHFLLMILQFFK